MAKKLLTILIVLSFILSFSGCVTTINESSKDTSITEVEVPIDDTTEESVPTENTESTVSQESEVDHDPEIIPETSVTTEYQVSNDTDKPENMFTPASPVSIFTDDDIEYLGVDVSGTERQIAEGIRQWQINNMLYALPELGFGDVSDAIRWNYFLPGIWPSKDIIYQHVDNGKVYGLCFDYAVIYCSIANYFGLETRIENSLSKPSDSSDEPALPGMDIDEYNRNKPQLDKYGLYYSYDAISSVAEETPTHYWAEVYLDGEWVVMDGTNPSTGGNTEQEYIVSGDHEVTDWLSRDKSAILDSFSPALNVDDLGQTDRASGMAEVMQGVALAPYFNKAEDAADFNEASAYLSVLDINEMNMDKADYESCSGKHLYLVSYLICDGEGLEGQAWADRYFETCGEELDLDCAASFISGD